MIKKYKKSELNITKDTVVFYKNLLEFKTKQLVLGKTINETLEEIEIEFEITDDLLNLSEAKKLTVHEKYRLILAVIESYENINENIDVDLTDTNILFDELFQVKFIERIFVEETKNKLEDFLRLLIFLFTNDKYNDIKKIDRTILNKSEFTKEFKTVQSVKELKQMLKQKIDESVKEYAENEVVIKKNEYRKLKSFRKNNKLIYIVLIIALAYCFLFRLPLMKKELNITTYYEQQDYSAVLSEAKNLSPNFLNLNIKYYIGVSTIKTQELSDIQKENLLANFSLNVDEDILDYWVYIAQGEFEKAKLKAVNVGDLDLQEYAVIKQLEMLDVQDLKDEEESELRAQYTDEINAIEGEKAGLKESQNEDSAI